LYDFTVLFSLSTLILSLMIRVRLQSLVTHRVPCKIVNSFV